MELRPFHIVVGLDNNPLIIVTYKRVEKRFTPEEISSMILSKMHQITEAFLGHSSKDAVIIVSTYLNDSQCQAPRMPTPLPTSTSSS